MHPCIWLRAQHHERFEPDDHVLEGVVHLTVENAWRLAEQLIFLVLHHYQGEDALPDDRMYDFMPLEDS